MRLILPIAFLTLAAAEPLAQPDSLGLGPFADSLETRRTMQVRSLWPNREDAGALQRLTRLRDVPSGGARAVLTVAEYERGASVQVTLVGSDLGQADPPPPLTVGDRWVWDTSATTYAADTLTAGLARGVGAVREATRRIRPYHVIAFDGVSYIVETWDRGGGSRTWETWSPGHGSPHGEVAALVRGTLAAAFVELGVVARSGDPYPFGNLTFEVESAHRRLFGSAPDALTAESSRRMVGALADRALAAAEAYPPAFSTAPVDTLMARAIHEARYAFFDRPPPEAVADTVRRYLALGADPNATVQLRVGEPLAPLDRVDDLESTRALLEAGANPDGAGIAGSPLARAAGLGDLARVRLLLSAGADPDGPDYAGRPALVAAAWWRPRPDVGSQTWAVRLHEMLSALLDAGADPNVRGGGGRPHSTCSTASGGNTRVWFSFSSTRAQTQTHATMRACRPKRPTSECRRS